MDSESGEGPEMPYQCSDVWENGVWNMHGEDLYICFVDHEKAFEAIAYGSARSC
jgi:hypothetical protein